jgi:hypothetical protein
LTAPATHLSKNIESTSYQNFVNAIRSPATKQVYVNSLKRYMKHLKITDVDSLLATTSPKAIEAQLIDYIMSLRNDGLSHSTMKYLVAPIFTFYQLNDVVLNHKKINRYFGEYKRVVRDTVYTTEQIGLAFNQSTNRWEPEDAPLIRLSFDATDSFQASRQVKPILSGPETGLEPAPG